jgi:transcriptional regulator with XRE-family HTH domain
MRKSLDDQPAKYLGKTRGDLSYIKFAQKTGLSRTMLHKLELRETHITLKTLEILMGKLKIRLSDIFPDEF